MKITCDDIVEMVKNTPFTIRYLSEIRYDEDTIARFWINERENSMMLHKISDGFKIGQDLKGNYVVVPNKNCKRIQPIDYEGFVNYLNDMLCSLKVAKMNLKKEQIETDFKKGR
ncbi:MAG: hypothetical protein J6T10_04005 [Methanobrevibacter sp.]|nr:hypothetical protein [Methanobrevibacter sp.]